ncbi:carboxymuconolactone decarboxylase family protein [Arthrobacter sp. 24S4-2]|uniref:carboxymuconolactone decarboxylase family protein n=1 Tax=Arthrobacter sp. 24S4-2 TaxID=2575374 RepID=UPI0010C775C1|nr:carboxymuconolactone decarboxylase family protein [Arthrobacter sp. 24S4-2]QCO99547.1 carboxymuconolactone decarboxylase family protein [Arthrobacter sp. 24S4-2]
MSILATTPESQAFGLKAKIYDDDLQSHGYVAKHTKDLAVNPEAYLAFEALISAITQNMDVRRYELITLAAAQALGSAHCRLAHGLKALRAIDEEELVQIARDYHNAGLSPAEVAMMEYAERLSTDAVAMTDTDTLELRDHGFTDREILDITLAAAARNFMSRTLQAIAAEVDVPTKLSPQLRAALLTPLAQYGAAAKPRHRDA